MSPEQAIKFFGTQAELARVLGVKQPSIAEWKEAGEIPEARQYQIELATNGELRADKPANRKSDVEAAANADRDDRPNRD
jgi:DNA-binding transcriptional regulator YdaS (Cro superfamily)